MPVGVLAAAAVLAGCERAPEDALVANLAVVERYCTDCHGDAERIAELSLDGVDVAHVEQHPEVWEAVVRKLRGNLMPPPGEPRPERDELLALVDSLERSLDGFAAARGPAPGRVTLHRLNRTEYARAIKDMLDVNMDAAAMLPNDVASDGFDNVADVLLVSPTHLDLYIAAARDISIRAVGETTPAAVRSDYRSQLANYTAHVDGLPLGTRGGMKVEHYFPADGEYEFNITVDSPSGQPLRGYPEGWIEYRHKLVLTIDGRKVFEAELGGEEDTRAIAQRQTPAVHEIYNRFRGVRVPVQAGVRDVVATFVARTHAEGDYLHESFVPGEGLPDVPRINGTEIIGPYSPAGMSTATSSRERVFVCVPATPAEERPCAREIVAHLAAQAFRRPVDDADIDPLLAFYESGKAEGGFETGIQKALFATLASTKFLYRAEPGGAPAGAAPGSAYPISDLELAWRLAFFLFSQGPDEELLELAADGKLHEDAVLDAQVTRMLADPRSRSLVTNFAFQWLDVRGLEQMDPDPRLHPNFDEDLRAAFVTEMELFVDSILRADQSVLELLTADYTFVNDRLARHYGLPDVRTDSFQRVTLADPHRHGLLGKGSVLMVTSYPDRTSPVLRGVWIMEHLLGTPPSSPPPGVETNLTAVEGAEPRSVRERLALHRTDPSCNHCHGVIDPFGQPLETFNAIGEWRTRERDTGVPVDPTGEMAGTGRALTSVDDLRAALAAEPAQFVQALTEKLMTFALGRTVEHYDMPTVRAIVRDAESHGWRFEALVRGVVGSPAFRMREVPRDGGTAVALSDHATASATPARVAGDAAAR